MIFFGKEENVHNSSNTETIYYDDASTCDQNQFKYHTIEEAFNMTIELFMDTAQFIYDILLSVANYVYIQVLKIFEYIKIKSINILNTIKQYISLTYQKYKTCNKTYKMLPML